MSEVNKFFLFFLHRRKWLPQQLRKLSTSKTDKLTIEKSSGDKKKSSDKKSKEKQKEENEESLTTSLNAGTSAVISSTSSNSQHQEDIEDVFECELPPPMKPFEDQFVGENCAQVTSPSKTKSLKETDFTEIEQIVKEKMEKHEASLKHPQSLSPQISESDDNYINDPAISTEEILRKRAYALKELVSTEESYVQDLALVVNGYIAEIRNPNSEIPMPEDLKGGKERMIFGNIEAIYEWHRDIFLKTLRNCVQSPSDLSSIIKKSERKLHMYVVYCQNKPVSEHIVSEHLAYFDEIRQKLKHKLLLSDLLIKPVQRIMKYELLIKDILKHTKRAGLTEEADELEKALDIMRIVPKAANDMMDVGRLQKFEGKITAQGKLLLHGTLSCLECINSERNTSSIPKPKDIQVFLFEQNIIFSDIVGKRTQFTNPSYIYKAHIQVNKMTLQEVVEGNSQKFIISCTDPTRTGTSFICMATSSDMHSEWVQTINNQLQKQYDFVNAIKNPIVWMKKMDGTKTGSS